MKKTTVRFATPDDMPLFTKWAVDNTDIPQTDLDAVAKSKVPLILVVEVDDQPEMYMPLLPAVTIGYLGFRPGANPREKAVALKTMKKALRALMDTLSIEDAYVFTKAEYPMGKWALKNGFKQKEKDGFTLERAHV